MIFARKMPEFYIKIARKFFSRILGGGGHAYVSEPQMLYTNFVKYWPIFTSALA